MSNSEVVPAQFSDYVIVTPALAGGVSLHVYETGEGETGGKRDSLVFLTEEQCIALEAALTRARAEGLLSSHA